MADGQPAEHAEDPQQIQLRGSDAPLPGRCGSPLPGTNGTRFCAAFPLQGKTRCRKHGGKSLSGIAHPKFKHGRYAKALRPIRSLAKHYLAHRGDPDYLKSVDEIALNQARISQLIERLESGEAAAAWKAIGQIAGRLDSVCRDFDRARQLGDVTRLNAAIKLLPPIAADLRTATDAGQNELSLWGSINEQLFMHQKLVTAEVKRRQVDEKTMSADDVFTLVGAIVNIFATVVADRGLRRQFTEQIAALIGPSAGAIDADVVNG